MLHNTNHAYINRFSYFVVFLYQIHNLKLLMMRISILYGIIDVILFFQNLEHFFHELRMNTVDHPDTLCIV